MLAICPPGLLPCSFLGLGRTSDLIVLCAAMRSPPAALVLAVAPALSLLAPLRLCGYAAVLGVDVVCCRHLFPVVVVWRRRRHPHPFRPSPPPPYLVLSPLGLRLIFGSIYKYIYGSELSVVLLGRISETVNKTLLGLVVMTRLRFGTHWVQFCLGVSAFFSVFLTHNYSVPSYATTEP